MGVTSSITFVHRAHNVARRVTTELAMGSYGRKAMYDYGVLPVLYENEVSMYY